MRAVKVKIISGVYIFYLWILSKTCKIRIINNEKIDINNSVIGFWHGESFPMYLLIERWKDLDISAIATSDSRGDYIATIMEHYGVEPLRLPNGPKARHGINDIINKGKENGRLCICFSVDGPLGPYHEPKKMVFFIAHHCEKKYIAVQINIKGKITLGRRWDKYVIPLPFSAITFKVKSFGVISKEQLKDYDYLRQNIINFMEEK